MLAQLGAQRQGLSRSEAEERLDHFGANRLKPKRRGSTLGLFLIQFKSPIIIDMPNDSSIAA